MGETLIDALFAVVGAALCVLAVAGWWWESHGRREWEREMWRREMRSKKPRR